MLQNNLPVDTKTIYSLATKDEYRHDLYTELNRINKGKLFPIDYLSQKKLGQSKVFYMATEDVKPYMIDFVAEKIEMFNGKKQKFYLYKVSYNSEYDINSYLAVAGPYSMDTKNLNSTHSATLLYWEEFFDAKRIDEFFKEIIIQAENWIKEQKLQEEILLPPVIKN
jgi:hypothetical protein